MEVLRPAFPERFICEETTPPDYFLFGYLKSLVSKDRLITLEDVQKISEPKLTISRSICF